MLFLLLIVGAVAVLGLGLQTPDFRQRVRHRLDRMPYRMPH